MIEKEFMTMNIPAEVTIREVGPRDGFQSLSDFIPTSKKLQIIESIRAAGVKEIESTSFASPKTIPQLRDAAEVMAKVDRRKIVHTAMVPNLKGAQDAIISGVDKLVVVISASEHHNRLNVRRSITASLLELSSILEIAENHKIPVIGAVAVSFGCPYEGDVPEKDVFRIVESYLSRGADSIIMADTTGMATPIRVTKMIRSYLKQFPQTALSLHFHNNRGTAMANLLAALTADASMFDTALGGIGGCPYVPLAAGNLATEDVVFMLEDMGVQTGIDLDGIIDAAHLLEDIVGYPLPGQVMKSGPREPERAARMSGRSDNTFCPS
jgi:hydroxymethylglutaryl-CoA lyase